MKKVEKQIRDVFDDAAQSMFSHRDALLLKLRRFTDDKISALAEKQHDSLDNFLSDVRIAVDASEKAFANVYDEVRRVGLPTAPSIMLN